MMFRLVNAEYDSHSESAYVEFRAPDDDGGEIITATIFSFRSKSKLSKLLPGSLRSCLPRRGSNPPHIHYLPLF